MGKNNHKVHKNEAARGKEKVYKTISANRRPEVNSLAKELLKVTTSQELSNIQMAWVNYVEMNAILKRLKEIEPGMTARKREDHFEELLSWVRENGGMTDNVVITKFENMEYGLAAKRDLEEGEDICSVPSKLSLGLHCVDESGLNQLANYDPVLKGMGNVRLALLLILEYIKGPNSFWYPYIASLPVKYNTVLYFTPEDFQELKYSPMFESCLNVYSSIARQYAYFHEVFQASEDKASQLLRNIFTYDMYRWAASTVMTRQNILPFGTGVFNAFIPLWDMCNHSDGYVSSFSTDGENVCKAFKRFKKGEQIFIDYGSRNYEDFFLHNAFVYEGDHETYLLRLGISKSDVLYSSRSEVLMHHRLGPTSEFRIVKNMDPMTPNLETFLTVVNMTEDELRACLEDPELRLPKGPEVELKIYKYFFVRLNLLLKPYEVEKKVDGASLSDTRRLIRAQIESEKRCLRSALKFVKEKLDQMNSSSEEKTETQKDS